MLLHWNVRSSALTFSSYFCLFLQEARQNGHWEIQSGVFSTKRLLAQALPSSSIIIVPITRFIDLDGADQSFLPRSSWAYNRRAVSRWRVSSSREVLHYAGKTLSKKKETLVPRDKPWPENRIFPFLSRLPNTRRCGIDVEGCESFDNGSGNIFPTLNIQDAWTPHNRAARN